MVSDDIRYSVYDIIIVLNTVEKALWDHKINVVFTLNFKVKCHAFLRLGKTFKLGKTEL